jgi:hypothetical protein
MNTASAMNAERISVKKRKLWDRIGGDSTIRSTHANARLELIESTEKMSSRRTAIAAVKPIIAKLNRCRSRTVKLSLARASHAGGTRAISCPVTR